MKYQFIAYYQHDYPITVMCRVLEVSISGYYAWCKRAPSEHSRKDAQLAEQVKTAFQANRGVYGSPRIHAELHAQGIHCARKRVARLMREHGLFAQRPRHRTITTKSEKGAQVAPNLLQRDFRADQPNQKWVVDTTYIWTREGWLLLAVVLDLFSRMVARMVTSGHPGCTPGRSSSAHGSSSSPSTGWVTPSLGSGEYLHKRELSSAVAARRHASKHEPNC